MTVHAISANSVHTVRAVDFNAFKCALSTLAPLGRLEAAYYLIDTDVQIESYMVRVDGEWLVMRERTMTDIGHEAACFNTSMCDSAYLATVADWA